MYYVYTNTLLCCRLLRLPVAPAAAPDQQPHGKQPLQDANGRHDPPQLLPAPSAPPPQTEAQASALSLHSNAGTLRSNEPVSINVGSIANAYFASTPGADRMSVWGGSQYGPAQEASPAAALGSRPSFTRCHSLAAESQSMNPGSGMPARVEAAPFASNYMNGIPWETDSAASPLPLPLIPQQQQQLGSAGGAVGTHADSSCSNHSGHGQRRAMGTSSKPVHSSGDSNASSSANSKRSRGCQNNQPAAGALGRRPRAAANSPKHAAREVEAGSSGRAAPARSPPRYHQPRCAHSHCCCCTTEPFESIQGTPFCRAFESYIQGAPFGSSVSFCHRMFVPQVNVTVQCNCNLPATRLSCHEYSCLYSCESYGMCSAVCLLAAAGPILDGRAPMYMLCFFTKI